MGERQRGGESEKEREGKRGREMKREIEEEIESEKVRGRKKKTIEMQFRSK